MFIIPTSGTIHPPLLISTENIKRELSGPLFGLKGIIEFDFDPENFLVPIEPLTGSYGFIINVTYHVTGLFANALTRLMEILRLYCTVELSLDEVPDWAGIQIQPANLIFEYSTEVQSDFILIIISVNENSPAFETSYFKIKAKTNCQQGPFGNGVSVMNQSLFFLSELFYKYGD